MIHNISKSLDGTDKHISVKISAAEQSAHGPINSYSNEADSLAHYIHAGINIHSCINPIFQHSLVAYYDINVSTRLNTSINIFPFFLPSFGRHSGTAG